MNDKINISFEQAIRIIDPKPIDMDDYLSKLQIPEIIEKISGQHFTYYGARGKLHNLLRRGRPREDEVNKYQRIVAYHICLENPDFEKLALDYLIFQLDLDSQHLIPELIKKGEEQLPSIYVSQLNLDKIASIKLYVLGQRGRSRR